MPFSSSLPPATSVGRNQPIVEAILVFLPFEYQAGKLRLVSRTFKLASESLLARKVYQTKFIGIEKSAHDSVVVRAYRGWSQHVCVDHKSCIQEALQMAYCRCVSNKDCYLSERNIFTGKGGNPDSCIQKALQSEEPYCCQHWDMNAVRQLLQSKGRFEIFDDMPHNVSGRLTGDQEQPGVYLCLDSLAGDNLVEIRKLLKTEMDHAMYGKFVNKALQNIYGIECPHMTWSRFLKCIFLVFQRYPLVASLAKFDDLPEPHVSMVRSMVDEGKTRYYRKTVFFRFFTNANDPVEIHFQCKWISRWDDSSFASL